MVVKNTTDQSGGGIGGLEGRVLVDRYRVVHVLSAGANTVIADAFDIESNQPVTFKIVRPELSASEEFRREFRRRAEVAMALTHPNIAAVLDWGDIEINGETTVFWVVEYLAGGSLRDLFDRGRLLQPSQALVVGLEACRALDAAHQRGITHTELTPSKLVFGEDRRLRIIDFGMAELLGRQAWADPATVATHVARYSSPEQALGVDVDPTTDVFALALCLLEAVTGKVPFSSDSTVSTLAGRVGKLMPVSADLGALAAVLERAGRPEPEDRSTAAEFGRALVQAAEKLPRPEPIPIVAAELFDTSSMRRPTDPTGGIARPPDIAAEDPPGTSPGPEVAAAVADTETVPSTDLPDGAVVPSAPIEPSATDPSADGDVPTEPPATDNDAFLIMTDVADPPTGSVQVAQGAHTSESGPFAQADAVSASSSAAPDATRTSAHVVASAPPATEQMPVTRSESPATHELYDEERPRRRTGVILALSLFVLAGLAAVGFAGYLLLRTKTHEVPDLTGVQEAVALNEISGNGWQISTERERSDEQPVVDAVIRTFPAAGSILEEGDEFRLFVSEGPLFRVLPEVANLSTEAAQAALESLQLSSFVEGDAFDETVPIGTVIAWAVRGDVGKVAGDEVLPGTTIALTVSKGPAPRVVPSVVGTSLEQAVATALAVQLNVVAGEEVFSDDVPVGIIVSQDAAEGSELPRDGTITVQLSKGIDLVALPVLDGLSYTEAQTALTDAGFTIGSLLGTTEGTFESISIAADPIDGLYRRGTSVDLIFL